MMGTRPQRDRAQRPVGTTPRGTPPGRRRRARGTLGARCPVNVDDGHQAAAGSRAPRRRDDAAAHSASATPTSTWEGPGTGASELVDRWRVQARAAPRRGYAAEQAPVGSRVKSQVLPDAFTVTITSPFDGVIAGLSPV